MHAMNARTKIEKIMKIILLCKLEASKLDIVHSVFYDINKLMQSGNSFLSSIYFLSLSFYPAYAKLTR